MARLSFACHTKKSFSRGKVRLLVKMQMGIDKVRLSLLRIGPEFTLPVSVTMSFNAHWSGKIACHLANHREATATVVPQIDDKCFSIGNKAKCTCKGWSASRKNPVNH